MSYDSWLTTDTDAEHAAAGEDKIAERVKELVNHNSDYDHRLFENFSNDVYSATIEQAESIEDYLRNKDFEKLGRLLWCISVSSRETIAQIQAQKDYENGELDD
jgi:predicted house-cleaning noncanonical NTP pyrophosphatase (MazG superfamily)